MTPQLPPAVIVQGHELPFVVARIAATLPCLRGTLEFCHVPSGISAQQLDRLLPDELAQRVVLYWADALSVDTEMLAAVGSRLPTSAKVVRFASPLSLVLWPFTGEDRRRVPEPAYPTGRYTYTDRLAASLAGVDLPDDYLFARYMELAAEHLPDMQAMLDAEAKKWRQAELDCDIKLAEHIERSFRMVQMFRAPHVVSAELARHTAWSLLRTSVAGQWCEHGTLSADFEAVLRGYVGRRWEEVPVNPLVAQALELRWWAPDMTYAWFSNRWDFRAFIINYIRWAPWCH